MKTYRIKHVDAFTTHPFSGNPAGVVIEAKGLSESEMQSIGKEKNLPETAFVLPPTVKGADLRIRWFTPTNEIDLCGHATIASFHALAEEGLEGMTTQGQHYFKLETKRGILSVKVEKNFQGTTIEFQLPIPEFRAKKSLPPALLKSLGISLADIDRRLPIVAERDLYIPVKKLAKLQSLHPDFGALRSACDSAKIIGVCLFTLECSEKNSSVHSRFFAPSVGINEDPVTGSANGPLGVYLYKYVLPTGIKVAARELSDGRTEFIGEQGSELGRPGHVKIRLLVDEQKVKTVSIAGEAVTVMNSIISF